MNLRFGHTIASGIEKPVTDMTTEELEQFVASGAAGVELEQNESITFNTKYCSDPRPSS